MASFELLVHGEKKMPVEVFSRIIFKPGGLDVETNRDRDRERP